jgi:hypothetical protein
MALRLLALQHRSVFLPEVGPRFGLVRDGDVAGVVLLGALEGEGGDEGGRLVAVLVGGDLAPGVGAAGVRARDVVDEGDVDAAGEDEVPGYVLEGGFV